MQQQDDLFAKTTVEVDRKESTVELCEALRVSEEHKSELLTAFTNYQVL